MTISKGEKRLLILLRVSFWNRSSEGDCFELATAEEWQEVVRLAVVHGVNAVAYDGAMLLPENLQPPRDLKLSWTLNVEALERRFAKQSLAASRLAALYRGHGLEMLVLKGPELASYYPVPEHREYGDIDIWLMGEAKRGDEIIAQRGIKVQHVYSKHSVFDFEGVHVENHHLLLGLDSRLMVLENVLNAVLEGHECRTLNLLGESDGGLVLIPPPMFSALFLARHTANHILSNAVLRHLCDWAMFLNACHGQYNEEELRDALRKYRLLPLMAAFTELAIEELGLPAEFSPFTEPVDKRIKERIWCDIIRPYKLPNVKNDLGIIFCKCNRLLRTQWKYKMVNGRCLSFRLYHSARACMKSRGRC